MAKYVKKPVVIEAYQTDKEMIIHTLEGDMKASVGDYIITGVNGEQYPCKPDIFKKTYEPVEDETKRSLSCDGIGAHTLSKGKVQSKDYIERMKDEEHKLLEKWDKLNSFRYRHCTQLDETELYLMGEQVKVIDKYIRILDARIAHAILKESGK